MKNITFIEPAWRGSVHLIANIGLLRIAHAAIPKSDNIYIGDEEQIKLIKEINPLNNEKEIKFIPWRAKPDSDTLPTKAWMLRRKLNKASAGALHSSDLIVLTSCTANTLTAITWMGVAAKSVAILHGNANELTNWRSRNPIRRMFDLPSSLKRFCKHGGTVVVLEERIRQRLSDQIPWISKSIECLPHALTPEEASAVCEPKPYTFPIKIGFAGLATNAKGFPEFLELANEIQKRKPGAFEFHAFGKLHTECKDLDQSLLTTCAGTQALPRDDFVNGLKQMHYIFVWHKDYYYSNAASGVLYDAINLCIPVIARSGSQVSVWEDSGTHIGSSHSNIQDAANWLSNISSETESRNYQIQVSNQATIRESLGIANLSKVFLKITNAILDIKQKSQI